MSRRNVCIDIDGSGLKKEVEKRLAKVVPIMKVANISTASSIAAMEVAMGMMVTSVTRIMDSFLASQTTRQANLEESGVAKVAIDTVDMDIEVAIVNPRNEKVLVALGAP